MRIKAHLVLNELINLKLASCYLTNKIFSIIDFLFSYVEVTTIEKYNKKIVFILIIRLKSFMRFGINKLIFHIDKRKCIACQLLIKTLFMKYPFMRKLHVVNKICYHQSVTSKA